MSEFSERERLGQQGLVAWGNSRKRLLQAALRRGDTEQIVIVYEDVEERMGRGFAGRLFFLVVERMAKRENFDISDHSPRSDSG